MLQRVGLGERLYHHSSQLSGGQQQRVAIARALVNNPSIIMGDEPTGNLDSHTSREVIRIFRELNTQSGITVIIVTHDQHIARSANRVVVLGDGEIVDDTDNYGQAMQSLESFESAEPVLPE
jgi:ABC-type lipoprotein export system ATPase subunit